MQDQEWESAPLTVFQRGDEERANATRDYHITKALFYKELTLRYFSEYPNDVTVRCSSLHPNGFVRDRFACADGLDVRVIYMLHYVLNYDTCMCQPDEAHKEACIKLWREPYYKISWRDVAV